MPGSLVRDTLAPVLQNGTLTTTTTTTGVQVDRPGKVRVKLVTGTVTGTTPTLDVEVQSSDDSTFATGVISHGRFATVTASATTRYLQAYVGKAYMRVIATVAGTTPSFGTTVIDVREANYERIRADTA